MIKQFEASSDFSLTDRKFILAEVEQEGDLVVVLRIGEGYHRELLEKLREEVGSGKIRCLGGGKIERMEERILIFASSSDFGREPREVTREIVERHFPGLDIETTQ